jgi:hypothetical protein
MLLSLLAMLAVAVPSFAQQGALTSPRNIQQLTERAETIVLGRVISTRIETHPELGVGVRVVTLKVHESLKGSGQDTLTFRQYVWDVRERLEGSQAARVGGFAARVGGFAARGECAAAVLYAAIHPAHCAAGSALL